MPISLPPIDRRRFLQGTLAGAAAALLPASMQGRETMPETAPSDVWAFLSDTHIPADRSKTGGKTPINPVEHLGRVRNDVLSGEAGGVGRPNALIVTGDCVYIRGLPEDYVTFLEEMQPFREHGLAAHFVMGNHDNRRAFLDATADAEKRERPRTIPDRLCSVLETPRADFFLLDSLDRTNHTPGLFGETQLDWLADNLDTRKDKPAIIFAHHYPDFTAGLGGNPHALTDTPAFYERILGRKRVKAFVFGHSHVWRTLRKDGVHLVNLPATAWRFSDRQPYAWVLAELRDDGMTLTLRSIEPEHPNHNQRIDLAWRGDS